MVINNTSHNYFSFIASAPEVSDLYLGQYSPLWVAVSITIAIFASYTALAVVNLAELEQNKYRKLFFLVMGGITLGIGVWAMHFIGMLGFSLPCNINYDPVVTALSMAPGILAGLFSLFWI